MKNDLLDKRWLPYIGGNFVLVVTPEFNKWREENGNIGGPYRVCSLGFDYGNTDKQFHGNFRRAVKAARHIARMHNYWLEEMTR